MVLRMKVTIVGRLMGFEKKPYLPEFGISGVGSPATEYGAGEVPILTYKIITGKCLNYDFSCEGSVLAG